MSDDNEPLLSRWSKRKLAKEVEPDADQEIVTGEEAVKDPAREAELLANLEAAESVDLETLDENSNLSVFLKDGVPEILKRRAMAALWRSSPVFANVDGLVDYDDDFGSPDLIMKTFQSAWQVGRGYPKNDEEEGEAIDQTVAENKDDNKENELDDDSSSDDIEEEVAVGESSVEPAQEMESVDTEPNAVDEIEPETSEPPRVSLRRRLMLEDEA